MMIAPAVADRPRAPAIVGNTRIASIDRLRGLDVLLMLFVNEMAGVRGTPAFLLHTPARADGMTITDTVFPAFLFITGMSIPLALGARLGRGDSPIAVWRHILSRSAALIVIGAFMVNAEYGTSAGVLSQDLWNVLMLVAALLVWRSPSAESTSTERRVVRGLGIAMLVGLALLYRSPDVSGVIQMRLHWWGILGLIGWAYVVAATVYLLVGPRPVVLLAISALLYILFFIDQMSGLPIFEAIRPYMNVGPVLGSHAALVLSGTVPVVVMMRARDRGTDLTRVVWEALGYGAALVAAGVALHQFKAVHRAFWINKPMATPAWCLISAGTTAAWAALIYVAEVTAWRRWPKAVAIAGENALLIYLLAPLLSSLLALSAPLFGGVNPYAELGGTLVTGTLRSIVFAWVVVRLSGVMRGRGISPRI